MWCSFEGLIVLLGRYAILGVCFLRGFGLRWTSRVIVGFGLVRLINPGMVESGGKARWRMLIVLSTWMNMEISLKG